MNNVKGNLYHLGMDQHFLVHGCIIRTVAEGGSAELKKHTQALIAAAVVFPAQALWNRSLQPDR